MNIPEHSLRNLEKFAPVLENTSVKTKIWIGLLLAAIGWGLYALLVQIMEGHGVTGMRDYVAWGLYIVNFMFFMGIAFAGAVIASVLQLTNFEWRKPIERIAELMALSSIIIGPIFIVLCVGRFDRLHHLFIYGRVQSPITWDVIAVLFMFVACVVMLYLGLVHHFANLRDYTPLKVAPWRKKLYRFLAINYQHTPEQEKLLRWSQTVMAVLMIPLAIIVRSVLAWLFGLTKQAGWHSSIFAPYFVLAALFLGTCVLILVLAVSRKAYNLQSYISFKHFNYLANTLLVVALVYGYFTFSEYFTMWYGGEKAQGELLHHLFDLNEYGGWFIYANFIGILLPVLMLAIPKFRSITSIVVAAVIGVTAIWIKSYLLIIPTLENPHMGIQDVRPEWISYSVTWVEIALTVAGIATFCLIYTLAGKFVTLMPSSTPREE